MCYNWRLIPRLRGLEVPEDTLYGILQLSLYFGVAPKSLQMVIAAKKLKDAYSLEGKL